MKTRSFKLAPFLTFTPLPKTQYTFVRATRFAHLMHLDVVTVQIVRVVIGQFFLRLIVTFSI